MMSNKLSGAQSEILQRLSRGETLVLLHGMYSSTWRIGENGHKVTKNAADGLVKRKLIERDQNSYDGWLISTAGREALAAAE